MHITLREGETLQEAMDKFKEARKKIKSRGFTPCAGCPYRKGRR